jgi:hypothetical protein
MIDQEDVERAKKQLTDLRHTLNKLGEATGQGSGKVHTVGMTRGIEHFLDWCEIQTGYNIEPTE